MTTHEAKVEVLTAEVRVLQVSSRQVTMSVYEQLDIVDPEQIEPFGRVSSRRAHCSDGWGGVNRDCPGDCLDVVGRDRSTGMLVRSCMHWYANRPSAWEALPLIVLAGLR
jgi:hypothetical protein